MALKSPIRHISAFIVSNTSRGVSAIAELLVMAALCNRAGHYIFALWSSIFFFFFSSPNFSGRRLDVYHTSTHGVALVRI